MSKQELKFILKKQLSSRQSKSLIPIYFDIPANINGLELDFVYDPVFSLNPETNQQYIERAVIEYLGEEYNEELFSQIMNQPDILKLQKKIRNLLNWNIYDPNGIFRGRWDWKEKYSSIWLGSKNSSNGFVNGTILAGKWTIILEIHFIATELCNCQLQINFHEKIKHPGNFDHSKIPSQTNIINLHTNFIKALVQPRDGWLRGEMHAHTNHSDGIYSVEELAHKAKKSGLDFIALTDHNTTSGHEIASQIDNMTCLPGQELTTFFGHFCLYGIKETVSWYEKDQVLSIQQIADNIRKHGALVSVAHPFQVGDPVCVGCHWPGKDPLPDRLDLMEVWYGSWSQKHIQIQRALNLWDQFWKKGLRPVGIAARDWHGPKHDDQPNLPFARTLVATKSSDPAAILQAIKSGTVYMTIGPHIDIFLANGEYRAHIGQKLELDHTNTELLVEISQLQREAVLTIKHNGIMFFNKNIFGNNNIRIPVDNPGYYRAEIWSPEGELLLLTNHLEVIKADD